MARRSQQSNPEQLRIQLITLLENFESELKNEDLRSQVIELVPAYRLLYDLGSSLVTENIPAARDRIIYYLKKYPLTIINGEEIMVVAGISEWARRVRELRVQLGWSIITGVSALEMANEGDLEIEGLDVSTMKPDQYMLINTEQDREAAHRWNVANGIRKEKNISVQEKLLKFLRENVGRPVTGEELRYVAGDKSEWARRVRELRTEQGWPIITKQTGMPELPVGTYFLELDRQAPVHDRKIPDSVRGKVLRRDEFTCKSCGWKIDDYNRADPRILELHHKVHHAAGGENTEENLITLCNICHDKLHAEENRKKNGR
ncbi:HNH endonuclease [Thiomicrorhabdus sediminis]|uniref:HNH endonuclease n=1 Tax=Thiomicrorhabdus sediminis TaxID=2580412 RepID=A0A4P9K509_9GAMM|nr:HNH endonuclease signature motif containing protein [Thiomicrorhabdus sediminis]QCU89510.1 HNH endonuclease [Thiomicrorhabdus sediminis]